MPETNSRVLLANRAVGSAFVLLVGLWVVLIAGGVAMGPNQSWIVRWPFWELGRRSSFAVGCAGLRCVPLVWGFAILYMYLLAVLVGNLYRSLQRRRDNRTR